MTTTARYGGWAAMAAAVGLVLTGCGSGDGGPADGAADAAGAGAVTTSDTSAASDAATQGPDAEATAGAAAAGGEGSGPGSPGRAKGGGPAQGARTDGSDQGVPDEGGPRLTPPPDGPAADDPSYDRSRYSQAERDYLDQLDSVGVQYTTILAAVDAGNVTCVFMERRRPYGDAVDYVQRNLGTDARSTGAVARAAIDNLCPEQEEYTDRAEAAFRMGEQ